MLEKSIIFLTCTKIVLEINKVKVAFLFHATQNKASPEVLGQDQDISP